MKYLYKYPQAAYYVGPVFFVAAVYISAASLCVR